jgi:hypothetical protein
VPPKGHFLFSGITKRDAVRSGAIASILTCQSLQALKGFNREIPFKTANRKVKEKVFSKCK